MSMAEERLPYPGLRSFTREETDLFFGREGCVDAMVDRLAATRFLAVLGASGSGKSSLVKTGLLDGLELGLLAAAGSYWLIADFKPGDKPIANMARGLLVAAAGDPEHEPAEDEVRWLRALLVRSPRSIVEWATANLPEGANLLLLVDQFEELFRYSEYAEREEAEAFAALLLESARASLEEARIYVTITMRSEYLGAAALIDGLAEAINRGLYLTPRMSRDEVREAVMGPAAVCGFEIEPLLVNRLLNDLTTFAPWEESDTGHQLERLVRRADQLPLMQHVLNRMWSIAAARGDGGKTVLTLKDYEAVGGLRGALAAHGREILEELLPEHRAVAPAVFRALTAGSSLAEAVRRPTEFGDLVEIAHGDQIAVREIVDAFRAQGRNFLAPPRIVPLRPDTLIDISHESLIRQWEQFATWLHDEATAADSWRRLVDQAERRQRGEADLAGGPALANLASWWDTEQPNRAWAKRYGGDYELAKSFLEESRQAEAAAKAAEAEERRRRTRTRMMLAAAVMIAITGFAGVFAYFQKQAAAEAQALALEAQHQGELARQAQADAEAAAAEAETQRELAIAAAQSAEAAADEADRQRQEADRQRQNAEEQRQNALQAQADAEAAAEEADRQRELALLAKQEAEELAAEAEQQRQNALQAQAVAEEERQRADQERERALLELAANRVFELQQEGDWATASNLLGHLWQDYMTASPLFAGGWSVDPLQRAFLRQTLAEYPTRPDFLNYSSLDGWSGRTGRFRVYGLDRMLPDGSTAEGNKRIVVFDILTGAVTAAFGLPPGVDLGSKPDRVSPDGRLVSIITSDNQVAMWAAGWPQAMFMPVPQEGENPDDMEQIAPLISGDRFVLYFERDYSPSEVKVVEPSKDDPSVANVIMSISAESLAVMAGYETVYNVSLLGLVDDHLFVLADGVVLRIDIATGEAIVVPTDPDVAGAAITPDGRVLLTLACPGSCEEQRLRVYDLHRGAMGVWFSRVPKNLTLAGNAFQEVTLDGQTYYSVYAEYHGTGIVYRFPDGHPEEMEAIDGKEAQSIGAVTYDGDGGFRQVEDAQEDSSGELVPAGQVTHYRVPLSREKLALYVAPNSVAVYEGEDGIRVAGVDYDGQLLVYRLEPDGRLEEDYAYPQTQIAESDCISAVAFGGDGQSLLFRHTDGSLRYVTAIGAGIDWHQPRSALDGTLIPSSPPTNGDDCPDRNTDETNSIVPQIVALDESGDNFMLLDEKGLVWLANVASETGEGADDLAQGVAAREFSPLVRSNVGGDRTEPNNSQRAGESQTEGSGTGAVGVTWIASDRGRRRVAVATGRSVEVRQFRSPEHQPAETQEGGEGRTDEPPPGIIPSLFEPKVVTFAPDGRIVIVYAGGQFEILHNTSNDDTLNGNWVVDVSGEIAQSVPANVFAAGDRLAIVDDHDLMVSYDMQTGDPIGSARIPADPSQLVLLDDGRILSVEWDTDGAAILDFDDIASHDIEELARLVTMRSLLDSEEDDSVDALTRGPLADEHAEADGLDGPSEEECAAEAKRRLALLELRMLGDSAPSEMECPHATVPGSVLSIGQRLVERSIGGNLSELVDAAAFSRLLASAAAGDAAATRLLGALLERSALRGDADTATIASDAARFGTSLPVVVLKEIAAGGPIDPALVARARERQALDPSAHQLLAHSLERRINDMGALTEALYQYSVAERLFQELAPSEGLRNTDNQRYVAHRRAQLARLLPDDIVLSVQARLSDWTPQPMAFDVEAVLPDAPSDAAERRQRDLDDLARLMERLPDSPLLALLEAEIERGHIRDLAATDPRQAVDLLLELESRTQDQSWSPGVVEGYLDFAGDLNDDESTFRLAIAAVERIGDAFDVAIHYESDAVGLFTQAVSLAVSSMPGASDEAIAQATADLELPFIRYQYTSLPELDAPDAVTAAAMNTLTSAAELAAALEARAGGPGRWGALRGEALFWQGILVNDEPDAKDRAAQIFRTGAEALRPFVEANPSNLEARFLYAETLRWIGLTEPVSEEIVGIIQESVDQYARVWDARRTLDSSMVGDVGVGYGFALANLARKTRDVRLSNGDDFGSAEDNVGWVLEALALASEKDELNAEMIAMGAASGDSGFMSGWYRMVSYGLQIGFLSGMVNVENNPQPVTECDRLGADINDPTRRAPGRFINWIDVAATEAACRAEFEGNPDDLKALHQLARSLYEPVWESGGAVEDDAEYMLMARAAAEGGVSAAFTLIADAIDSVDTARGDRAYHAASQRILIESFPILFPYLQQAATTERERIGLAWYARRAAALGVTDAVLAIANLSEDPIEKRYYFSLAERLFEEADNGSLAAAAGEEARSIEIGDAAVEAIEARVADWVVEPLVALPESVEDSS